MPLAQISILEGRDDEKKERLIRAVTDAIESSLDAPRDTIRVVLTEIPKQHWGVGGESVAARGKR